MSHAVRGTPVQLARHVSIDPAETPSGALTPRGQRLFKDAPVDVSPPLLCALCVGAWFARSIAFKTSFTEPVE